MTIATLIITCVIFVALGWTGDVYGPVALSVGAIVCIAAANAGNTSQDLKTGYIVGATPIYQQMGLAIGVVTSAFIIGMTVLYMHNVFGIGSADVPAPQATLMATLIKGLLSQNLPWGLVLVGVFIAVTLELCGIHSLSFAVGAYSADRDDGADLHRRPGALVGRAQDRRDQRVGSERRHAVQLGPDRGRLAGRHSLRGPVRRRTGWRPFQVVGDMMPALRGEEAFGQIAGGVLFFALAVILARFASERSRCQRHSRESVAVVILVTLPLALADHLLQVFPRGVVHVQEV